MSNRIKIVVTSICLLGILVPIFFLSFYIHPATDDYGFYLLLKKMNIFKSVLDIMNGMDSRLSGDFYSLLFCPAESLLRYRLTIAGFIVLFFASVYMLFVALNKSFLRASSTEMYLFFAIFCFLFVGNIPGLSEAFYWYSGVAIWMFGVCLFNFFIVLILNYHGIKSTLLKRIALFIACFLGFSFTTHNEILLLFMGILSLFCVWEILKNKDTKFKVEYIAFCISVGLGFLIVLFLKGNYERIKFISANQDVSLTKVLIYNILLYRKFFFLTDVVLLNVFLFPFYYSVSENTKRVIAPLTLIFISAFLLFVMILPSFIAKTLYSFRIQDVVFYFFIMIISYNFSNFAAYLRCRKVLILKGAAKYSYVLLVFFIFHYASQREDSQKVLRVAYTEILSGKTKKYDQEMKDRYLKIIKSPADTIVLAPIKTKVKSIFYDDITTNATDWRNILYRDYFNKKSIRLSDK